MKRQRKHSLLNVRDYIEYGLLLADGYAKWGKCPALDDEMRKFKVLGAAIIKKHDRLRASGNRKDLYVEAERSRK